MTAPQLAPGTVVAQKYQLGPCLGYAGSSATYLAVGPDGREVVLKIFDPGIRQRADIMSAIEQTYAATNALPQDVVAPLLDAGYDAATGAPFSVGERMPFPSLAQLVAQRPLPGEEVARILQILAGVLEQSHARQLFHHALKPTNVFVGFAQGHGIRVTDFGAGLARAAVPTQEGYALAAPWLAPEQVQGTVPAGAAADVFAAGLLAFFALTGRSYWRACQGTLDLAAWQQELMGARTPSSARAMQLGVPLTPAFDGVIGCALSADPRQRYRSVRELWQAFEPLTHAAQEESQATMAFPVGAMGFQPSSSEYPPPPPPTGGYQAAPGQPQSPYGAPQAAAPQPGQGNAQWGAQAQPQAAAAPPGAQGNPAYVSTQTPAQAEPPPANALAETSAGRPIDPAVLQRRAAPSRMVPILVGLVAILLIVGAAAAFVVMGKRSRNDGATASSASASAAPISVPVDTASAAPADSASAAPSASASAAPADSASAAPSADATAAPPENLSSLACDPECDEIKVDDKAIEIGKPLALEAGKHTIVASKSGFVTSKETLTVKAGQKVERTFKLKPVPAVAAAPATGAPANAGGASAGPTKPCGKFLKRGAGCK